MDLQHMDKNIEDFIEKNFKVLDAYRQYSFINKRYILYIEFKTKETDNFIYLLSYSGYSYCLSKQLRTKDELVKEKFLYQGYSANECLEKLNKLKK